MTVLRNIYATKLLSDLVFIILKGVYITYTPFFDKNNEPTCFSARILVYLYFFISTTDRTEIAEIRIIIEIKPFVFVLFSVS